MKLTPFLFPILVPLVAGAESIFPLKISENRRHFVTHQGKPFLDHADTAHPPAAGWETTDFAAISYGLVSPGLREGDWERVLARCLAHGNVVFGDGVVQASDSTGPDTGDRSSAVWRGRAARTATEEPTAVSDQVRFWGGLCRHKPFR